MLRVALPGVGLLHSGADRAAAPLGPEGFSGTTAAAPPGTGHRQPIPDEAVQGEHGRVDNRCDVEDFSDYVAARLPDLLRFGHALTGNPHDASDLVQDVLEKVGVRWSTLRQQGAGLDAYVRRAMVNTRISRWRRRRHETLVADIPETGFAPPDRFDDEPLWQALSQLPTKQRAVLVLRYYEGLSEADIADSLGISTGTVKSHTSRAMTALRSTLATEEGTR